MIGPQSTEVGVPLRCVVPGGRKIDAMSAVRSGLAWTLWASSAAFRA